MDVIRSMVAAFGSVLYTTLSTPLYLLPTRSRRRAEYILSRQASLASLVLGRLLPTLHPPYIDLSGKIALITGANSGIGLSLSKSLALRGATIYLACRNASKAEFARLEILHQQPSARDRVHILSLDTADLASVHACASTLIAHLGAAKLDLLVHNAGISTPPAEPDGDEGSAFSPQGFELVYATNFLGGFLLTHLLEQHLAEDARVVLTSSHAQYAGRFSGGFVNTVGSHGRERVVEAGFHCPPVRAAKAHGFEGCYANSKAMQCAFARLLQRRFDGVMGKGGKIADGTGRVVHVFSPGFTRTAIFGKIEGTSWAKDPMFKSLVATEGLFATEVQQGAATGLFLCGSQEEQVVGIGRGGAYWERMERRTGSANLLGDGVLQRLWERWEVDAGIEWPMKIYM
ncbi:uncharacterized protein HMPREF1541_04277 [Cyphellophora europaea CBS 101466]|uniref:Ketoreductase (KR) domain-containing protein n=1 Tax=Cyphellophora europaea (strain CBS 101466) TaxID=1220924 RepID=W2RU91_CYPE1|nr:uncharacterized protein HMPREF1541_04277 [Cyphellophora europaea CBS 101466]ETN40002.1 hypothetical protein HMPREF1541_04277 [Cyphellophora europaea CBS 101466]